MTSKKDYEAIARILLREHQKILNGVNAKRGEELCLTILRNKIAGYFQSQSDKFDWDRFAKASTYDDHVTTEREYAAAAAMPRYQLDAYGAEPDTEQQEIISILGGDELELL